jgi:hypothetical protein
LKLAKDAAQRLGVQRVHALERLHVLCPSAAQVKTRMASAQPSAKRA